MPRGVISTRSPEECLYGIRICVGMPGRLSRSPSRPSRSGINPALTNLMNPLGNWENEPFVQRGPTLFPPRACNAGSNSPRKAIRKLQQGDTARCTADASVMRFAHYRCWLLGALAVFAARRGIRPDG